MIKALLVIFVAAGILSLQTDVNRPGPTSAAPTETPLGYGDVVIDIPDGWTIDNGTVYIEIVTYRVKRPNASEPTMRIILSASTTHDDLGPGVRPYCINGLLGETVDKDGMRTIRLDIPPPSDLRPYDNKAIFKFQSADPDAAKIVGTARLKGQAKKCPSSVTPR